MEQIPIRSLNQDTAAVLARVERGETVEITNRGRAVARIVPVAVDTMADLIAAGMVVPPTVTGPVPHADRAGLWPLLNRCAEPSRP